MSDAMKMILVALAAVAALGLVRANKAKASVKTRRTKAAVLILAM
jgi:hypothetical protein